MADFTVTVSAASARALLAPSPMTSAQATAIRELITEWLQITAVPLLVFLIGACIWGCIENTMAWRMLTEDGGSARYDAADSQPIDSNHAATDLEAGQELTQVGSRADDDRDVSVDSTECTATDGHTDGRLVSLCETTSDIGDAIDC